MMTMNTNPNVGTNPPIDLQNPAGYTKLIGYIVVAVLVAAQPLIQDGVSANDLIQLVIAGLGSFAVWYVPQQKYAKALVTAGLAAAQALALIVTGSLGLADVTAENWIAVVLAGVGAITVGLVPNKKVYALAA